MTGNDIVAALRAEVLEPSPAFFTSAVLLLWINNAQKAYVRQTRCLQNFATTSTVQGQADYPMPSDWLSSEKVFYNSPTNGIDNWAPLSPTSVAKMAQESRNFLSTDPNAQSNPGKYYVVNNTLYIYPRPKTSGTNDIYMFYESKPITLNALSDALSIDDSLSDGIEAYVLWKMWKMDGEDALAEEQHQRYMAEIGQGLKWKKQRTLDSRWKIDIETSVPFGVGSQSLGMNPLNL
jgi:hypothetical protein